MPRMRLRDIAAEAGVSPATVSKYLNGHHSEMSAATRERIAAVVERTGYRPNRVARNLRLDRSRTLGVILADITNPYSSAMLEELSAQAEAAGYVLTCAISRNDAATEARALDRLMEAGVDGLVVNTCGGNDRALLAVNQLAPVVLLDRDVDTATADGTPALDLVTSDNAPLVAELVDEVAGAGCTRIHLITEADATSSVRRERALTFMRELGARSLSGSTLCLAPTAEDAAAQLAELAEAHEPLGLIAVNGLVFQQLVEAVALTGLAVPGRLRIATFDEYPWNRALFGGVTTAAQDTHAIAAATLARLVERIEATGPAESARVQKVPGHVIRRASTAR